jgi:hypothetical protein
MPQAISNRPAVAPVEQKHVGNLNKVVVAFLDGTRLKGHVFNFSMAKDSFDLLPEVNPLRERGKRVQIKDLKAVFFVKEFAGAADSKHEATAGDPLSGKTIEVTFRDGEKIVGQTDSYNPQRLAFFIVPPGAKSNNRRILVVHKNAVLVRLL